MSAVILEFAQHKPKPKPVEAPHYFCQNCECDRFKAFANGQLICLGCDARMNNIFVGVKPEAA